MKEKKKLTPPQEEFVKNYIRFLEALSIQKYSQFMMETACHMLQVLPKDRIEPTMVLFTEMTAKGLPEKDYHWEISQVFNEIMGY